MTFRRLGVLVEQLSNDPASALYRAAGGELALWTAGDWILADLYDGLIHGLARSIRVEATPKTPEQRRYPRPGDAQRQQQAADARRAALEAQRERIRRREEEAGG